ncbi:MAG: hypothetical protein JWN48_5617 [Myxococcaceae bacterium]|nr:hypothetical protein [Myxococcaceae bacterium]
MSNGSAQAVTIARQWPHPAVAEHSDPIVAGEQTVTAKNTNAQSETRASHRARARAGVSVYLDQSHLVDAFWGANGSAASKVLTSAVERCAREAELCLQITHLHELAAWKNHSRAAELVSWVHELGVVWTDFVTTVHAREVANPFLQCRYTPFVGHLAEVYEPVSAGAAAWLRIRRPGSGSRQRERQPSVSAGWARSQSQQLASSRSTDSLLVERWGRRRLTVCSTAERALIFGGHPRPSRRANSQQRRSVPHSGRTRCSDAAFGRRP